MKQVALIRSAVLPQTNPTHPCLIDGMGTFISDGDMMSIKKSFVKQLVNFGLYFTCK